MKKLLLTLAVLGAASFAFAADDAKKCDAPKDEKACCKQEKASEACAKDCSSCSEKGSCSAEKKADAKAEKKA